RTSGDNHDRDLGEGPGQAAGAPALPRSDRGRCARLRAGREGLFPLQRPARREGREHLLLLRGLQGPGRARGASQDAALREVAGRRRHAGRADRADALQDRLPGGRRVLGQVESLNERPARYPRTSDSGGRGADSDARDTDSGAQGAHTVNDAQRITGVLSPVVTPFKADLSPDPERFVRQCRWLLSQDVGLAVFGTNSEANSLSTDEKVDLLDRLVGAGVDPARMMPGTGCCALTDSVRLTAHAMKLGCGGVLMLPPFYYKGVSDDGLFKNFAEVIERVGDRRLRIYLYHIPPVSQVGITVGLIERLLKAYPGIVAGAKDSSGDWNNTKAYLDNFAKAGFDVFPGGEPFLLQGLRYGGVGCISATANVNPGALARLFATWPAAARDR